MQKIEIDKLVEIIVFKTTKFKLPQVTTIH